MLIKMTSETGSTDVPENIAAELELPLRQVLAAVKLLDTGNTIPFTRGPSPLTQKDIQTFANLLDRTLTRCLKKR